MFSFCTFISLFPQKKLSSDEEEIDAVTPTEHSLKENLVHVGQEVKQGVQKVGHTVKPVLQTVQTGVKSGVQSMQTGVKTGVQSVQSGVKAGVQSVSNMWTAFKNRRSEQSERVPMKD